MSEPPVYGKDTRLGYGEYLHVPQLLEQQACLSRPPAHDELQFIVVHQVYELWFKLVLFELDAVKAALARGADEDLWTALRLLRRVETIFKVLVQQIHVLESMRPIDFLAFRDELKPASGFQSVQFREVECLLGVKQPQVAELAKDDARIGELRRRLSEPSIPDALYELLRRRGIAVRQPGTPETVEALRPLYERPDEQPLLHALCEALVDLDEQLVLWRRHHVLMVERQIGEKTGTGAGHTGLSEGIRYLKTTLDVRAFPDLWAVRSVLRGHSPTR